MRAKPRIGRLLLIALIVSLVLGACGGGTTGSTWFNLPSVKLVMRENGTANLYGFNVNQVILQPALIQQLQSADIQRLEARIGYNGIHVLLNGEDMPYIAWDAESTENLQEVLGALPPTVLPNSQMIANNLPLLRRIGLGVRLDLPVASGSTQRNIARWRGETSVTPEQPGETTIGPIVIGSLVFDQSGEAIVEGMAVSELEQMLGTAIPLRLDQNILGILQNIGAETVRIATQPNGIDIFLNDEPLPSIAYDTPRLERTLTYAGAFIQDPQTLEMVNQLVPLLPGADITAAVSFTGEPAADTNIGSVTLVVGEDGAMRLGAGVPLAGAALPPDIVSNLQAANVQHLSVNLLDDRLAIAANGQVLPTISLADESMETMASLVAPLAGIQPALITEGLDVVRGLGADVSLELPPASGAEPVEMPEEIDFSMAAPEIGDVNVPTIQLTATYGDEGFTEVGGISASTLGLLGVTLPSLPPDLVNTLRAQNVSSLGITTGNGQLDVALDGSTALTVNYDRDSLQAALDLAGPFIGEESPVNSPVLEGFIREQILPILPAANVNVTVNLE